MADACYVYILSYIVRVELKDTKLRELERRAPMERNLRICKYTSVRSAEWKSIGETNQNMNFKAERKMERKIEKKQPAPPNPDG